VTQTSVFGSWALNSVSFLRSDSEPAFGE
jgi:hypothetical protein